MLLYKSTEWLLTRCTHCLTKLLPVVIMLKCQNLRFHFLPILLALSNQDFLSTKISSTRIRLINCLVANNSTAVITQFLSPNALVCLQFSNLTRSKGLFKSAPCNSCSKGAIVWANNFLFDLLWSNFNIICFSANPTISSLLFYWFKSCWSVLFPFRLLSKLYY
jgi:hypothetical protein